jgi:hypothetical protein
MHYDQPFPEDMIGAIKIKDGLFIGDSFAAQVSQLLSPILFTGLRICCRQQSHAHNQLLRKTSTKPLGRPRSRVFDILVARYWELNNFRFQGYNDQSNLRFYRKRNQKVRICLGTLCSRLESFFFCPGSLFYEKIQMVDAENAWIFELKKTRPGDQRNFYLATSIIWATTEQQRPRPSVLQFFRSVVQNKRLLKRYAGRRTSNPKHLFKRSKWVNCPVRLNGKSKTEG